MPIYAYRCDTCGHAKDVLQKMSDASLADCPACDTSAFKKQFTAAGFQPKGPSQYVTDLRGGSGDASAVVPATGSAAKIKSAVPVAAAVSSDSVSSSVSTPAASGDCGTSYACR